MANLVDQAKGQMEKSIESTKENFAGIRTGRANPALLNGITVEYYGAPTLLKAVATIGVPEPRTLSVTPFDPSQANAVEKAVSDVLLRGFGTADIFRPGGKLAACSAMGDAICEALREVR